MSLVFPEGVSNRGNEILETVMACSLEFSPFDRDTHIYASAVRSVHIVCSSFCWAEVNTVYSEAVPGPSQVDSGDKSSEMTVGLSYRNRTRRYENE